MEGLWPILILWALAALLGGKKKRPAPPPGPESPLEEERAEFGNELQRALAELKNAEAEAKRRAAAITATASPRTTSETRAAEYLEGRKARGRQAIGPGQRLEVFTPKDKSRERSVRRPVRPIESADDSMSSEIEPVVISLEGVTDYDLEAEAIVERRRKAAEQREHGSDALTSAQVSRRGERLAAPIGGAKQHAGFHARLDALPAPAVVDSSTRHPLARFGDGSVRSAIILAEILGRPVGEKTGE